MKAIKNVLKGMVIGIANIIPGVSGGTMMVAMGIYDKLIHCITHIFKEFKKSDLPVNDRHFLEVNGASSSATLYMNGKEMVVMIAKKLIDHLRLQH